MTDINLQNYILSERSSLISDAVIKFELNKSRTVFIADDQMKVKGVITEGDVVRALLSGIELKSLAKNIINISFKFVAENSNLDYARIEALKVISQMNILAVPIVNNEMTLIEVITIRDYFNFTAGFLNDYQK